MNNHRMVNGKKILLTPNEQLELNTNRIIDEKIRLAKQPMNDWIQEMTQSDKEITRGQEDLIDHLINDHVQIVNPVIKARRDKKKEIRSRRPQY